jgi:hypothetical protein
MRIRSDFCETNTCTDPAAGVLTQVDPRLVAFDRLLIKVTEHTWGLDIKRFLHDAFVIWVSKLFLIPQGDPCSPETNFLLSRTNWSNELLQKHINDPNFQLVKSSWLEQREYLNKAVVALANHPLAATIRAALQKFHPQQPDLSGYTHVSGTRSWSCINDSSVFAFVSHFRRPPQQIHSERSYWVVCSSSLALMALYSMFAQPATRQRVPTRITLASSFTRRSMRPISTYI